MITVLKPKEYVFSVDDSLKKVLCRIALGVLPGKWSGN